MKNTLISALQFRLVEIDEQLGCLDASLRNIECSSDEPFDNFYRIIADVRLEVTDVRRALDEGRTTQDPRELISLFFRLNGTYA